ncbi:hypothetical protein C5S32_01145 [ANME-1 cluster archaeon GoMg1]|nr:hypothetical protein [ANME-1 cluster archaeon GoMg1]
MKEISVVISTKNEEESIGICIEKIQKVLNEHHIDGEIIIADNSTDKTPEIAKGMGAKVIVPDEHGYGNAYRLLFEEASGDYIVMGSRFKGEIKTGAMPWHHQNILETLY